MLLMLATAVMGTVMVSCNGGHEPTEADLSEFGEYVYRLDTAAMSNGFKQMLAADTDKGDASKWLRAHYAEPDSFGAIPQWFSRMGVTVEADSLLSFLRRELPLNGLDTTAFRLQQIASDLDVVEEQAFDSLGIDINELLPRLDYNLSRAYVKFTVGLRYGFVRPARLLNNLDYRDDRKDYARLFDYTLPAPSDSEAVCKLTSIDRMEYLLQAVPQSDVYQLLQARLLATTDTAECRTLAINLERCRWQLPHPDFSSRMVLVNIPSQQLWAIAEDSIMDMRICCGSTKTKTPLLSSAISYIQVNPEWVIPQSIVKNEVAVHGGDSAYFGRHRYYIIDRSTGDTLNPKLVTQQQLLSGRLRVSQRGGAGNSLGRIVFRFANDFAVYLHDTSNRNAFNLERRTLSHGCVRVQKPFEMAQFLMPEADDWTLDRIRIAMDMKPETDRGRDYLEEHADDPRPLRAISYRDIIPQVPIYIIYYTAYPNPETSTVEIWPDIYGYDKVIGEAMKELLP